MALTATVLTDVRLYLAGADLTGRGNKIDVQASAEDLKTTNWASNGWTERVGGLFDGTFAAEGQWQAGDDGMPDDVAFASLGVSTIPVTAVPTSGAVGSLAYLTRALETKYQLGSDVGQVLMWSADAKTNWPYARGEVIHPQGTARTASGSGTARQLGVLSSAQAMYVNLHVLSYTDGSMTVTVESDDNSGMTTPTTRGTFTAATALGGQAMRIVGPIADDWWRVSWTISGGSVHSFLFAAAAGRAPK